MTSLSSIEYPHWLMIAGAILLVLGFVGLAWGQRGVAELHANASAQEPPEPENDVDQVEVYNRTAKEKRRDHQRGVAELHANASAQEPPEPENDVDQVEVYNRTAKEKRKDRWAERFDDSEEPVEKLGQGSK